MKLDLAIAPAMTLIERRRRSSLSAGYSPSFPIRQGSFAVATIGLRSYWLYAHHRHLASEGPSQGSLAGDLRSITREQISQASCKVATMGTPKLLMLSRTCSPKGLTVW